jgi:hypothetical protein
LAAQQLPETQRSTLRAKAATERGWEPGREKGRHHRKATGAPEVQIDAHRARKQIDDHLMSGQDIVSQCSTSGKDDLGQPVLSQVDRLTSTATQ